MVSITKFLAFAILAAVAAPSAQADSVKGRYVWKKLTTTSDASSGLSMGIHMPQ